ncbi:MAG: hypothetical protein FWG50_10795, partial [Kiritimatiellaeota bacterium]|nr:hypothetical protein [Kiritimatiellota bacterium]
SLRLPPLQRRGILRRNSPPLEGWQPQADGVVLTGWSPGKRDNINLNYYTFAPFAPCEFPHEFGTFQNCESE